MSPPRIFVSYSRQDEDFMYDLVRDLYAAGAEVWYDVGSINYGDFIKRINEALQTCEWTVLVLSPNAVRSAFVQMEVNAALHRVQQRLMRAVIPILASPCPPNSIPALWDVLQRYDATQDYSAALAGVLGAVGLAPTTSPSPPPAPTVKPAIPPNHFPARLADLGFDGQVNNGFEVILPPVCTVPAGPFLMGSDPEHDKASYPDELPQHDVTLKAYEIARFPVTVAEYACFVRAGQRQPQNWQSQLGKLDHPVVNVNWYDIVAYATWLTQRTRQVWRVPTEAEWEKAARGTDGRRYPWGERFDRTQCNTLASHINTTTPVGAFPGGTSPYGVYDLAGNVWEWTSSERLPYPYKLPSERDEMHIPELRVLRGGSWHDNARLARTTYRECRPSNSLYDTLGLRLMRFAPSS